MKSKYLTILTLLWTTAQAVQVVNRAPALVPTVLPTTATHIEHDSVDYEDDIERSDDDYDERYAREFPYGQPMEPYRMEERSSRQARAHVRFVHKAGKPHMYAKKYRTWAPSKEYLHPKYRPVKKLPPPPPPPQKRRPSRRGVKGPPSRRRKMPPARGNQLRRPKPPPEADYEYDDDYYPEESKRNEYTVDHRKKVSKNKQRRPPASDGIRNLYDDGGEETVSYMNFVHQPHVSDYNEGADEDRPRQPERKRKKKRKKGDRVRGSNRDADQFGATSEPVEEHQAYEKYPPYADDDQQPLRRPIRRPAPSPALPVQTTPLYGDGYIGNQVNLVNQASRAPQNVNLFNSPNRGGLSQYQNTYSGAQTFQNQPTNDFQGSSYVPNSYNDFGGTPQQVAPQQNYNPYTNQGYHNPSGLGQQFTLQNQPLNNPQPQTFHRPTQNNFAKQPTTAFPTRGGEYSSKYKSSSFFDNQDTFQDYNQNADFPQNNNRNNFVPSAEYQDQSNADTDFINRHLDLYSNGMSGVPVQGDGRQSSRTKDFDIGYGEIHYDETHATK